MHVQAVSSHSEEPLAKGRIPHQQASHLAASCRAACYYY